MHVDEEGARVIVCVCKTRVCVCDKGEGVCMWMERVYV